MGVTNQILSRLGSVRARLPELRRGRELFEERAESVQDRKEAFKERTAELLARGEHVPQRVLDRRVAITFGRMCRWYRPDVSIEIGAHEAQFSRDMKASVPDLRAVAYEANPYVHKKFVDEVTAAGVEYLHLAVASVTGTSEILVPRNVHRRMLSRANKTASLVHNRRSNDEEKVTVPAVRLDEHLDLGPEARAVGWIDVEGASQQVLEGSRAVLAHTGLLYIEVESAKLWDGQWLDHDVAVFLDDLGLVPILRDRQRPRQYNIVFAQRKLARHPWVRRQVKHVYRPAPD